MAFGYVKGRALAALSEEMGKGKVDYSEHKRDEAAKGQLIGQIAGNVGQIGIDALTQYSSKQERMVTDSGMLSETFKFGEEEFNIYQKDDNYGAFRPASQRVTTNTEFQEALKGNPAMQKAYYEHITKGGDGYLKHQERIASGMIDPIQGLNYDMGYAEQIETRNTQLASKYGNEIIKEDGTVDWKAVEVKKGENRQQEEQLKFDTEIKKMEDDFFGSELDKSISEMEASETITKSNLDDDYIKKLYEETDEQRKINEATVYVDSDQQAIEADPNASFENLQSKVRDSFVEQSEFDDLEYDMEIQENIKTKNGQTLFMVMKDGEPKFYKVNDEMLQTAVDSFGYKSFEQQHIAMKSLNSYKRFVSAMITKDPSFAFYANPVRDSVGGSITSNTWNKIPILDTSVGVYKALSATFGKDKYNQDLFLDYINNGGGFGTIFTQNAEQYGYQLKKYFNEKANIPMGDVIVNHKGLVGVYNDAIVAFEHATRLREYEKAIRLGYGPREAAVMAREVSVDFSMKGASSFVNGFNQTVPFFNPAIQGAYKSFRTWFGEGRFTETFIKTNMYVGAPTATLWYLNHNNPDYLAYPDYIKRQAWFIPAGTRFDEDLGREVTRFIIVPKPFDLYGMYANSTEAVLQAAYDTLVESGTSELGASDIMTEFVKSMYHNMGHALPPVPLPPAANLSFALFGNVDTFTGANIIPSRLEQVPAEFQFTPWSSETMNALGDATNTSPILIEQVYKNIMPGLGEHFLSLGDYFVNVATDDKYNLNPNRKITLEDIPIFDRAYEDGIPQISQYELDMFDKMDDALGDYLSETQLAELLVADPERIENWLSQDANREKMVTRSVFYSYLLETSQINTQIRLATQDKNISRDTKYRRILKYQEQKKNLAKMYLNSLSKMQPK